MIDVDLNHARFDRRWIGSIDDARGEQVVVERGRGARIGALATPQRQASTALLHNPVPLWRWPILPAEILDQLVAPLEANRRISRRRVVPELCDRLARLLC